MIESLERIKNPLVRSLTAAATAFSAVTLTVAVVIGGTNSKDKAAYQFGVYSSLIGTGCGALFGLVYASKESDKTFETLPQ